jgi:AraC-like DNA-binding protein
LTVDPIPYVALDTEGLSSDERFAAWAATLPMCEVTRLEPDAEFHVRARAWLLGAIIVSRTAIPPVKLTRSGERAHHDGLEYYLVVLSNAGSWRCETAGATISVPEGAVCLLDSTTPFEIVTRDGEFIILNIARERLDEGGVPGRFHGYALSKAAGQFFGDYLKALCRNLAKVPASEAPLVDRATRDLLVACLSIDAAPMARAEARSDVMVRVRRHIDERLGQQLSPIEIARSLGLSRTRLYSIFAPAGGVQSFIAMRRLVHAKRALEDPLDRRSIAAIGHANGFASSAHFSRAFRRQFGVAPKSVRARAGRTNEPIGPAPGHQVDQTLRAWRGVG